MYEFVLTLLDSTISLGLHVSSCLGGMLSYFSTQGQHSCPHPDEHLFAKLSTMFNRILHGVM